MFEASSVSSSMGGHVTRHMSIDLVHSSGVSDWFVGGNVTENRLLAVKNKTYV